MVNFGIIFFCCSKLCYQAFKYHFESCMCHVDFVYKAMISSKEIRRTGNDMKATVRFNVFLNVQNLILKKAHTTFFETLEWFCYSSLGILYFPFIRLWFSMFNIFACMISLFQSVLVGILCRKMYVSICYQLKLLNISFVLVSIEISMKFWEGNVSFGSLRTCASFGKMVQLAQIDLSRK